MAMQQRVYRAPVMGGNMAGGGNIGAALDSLRGAVGYPRGAAAMPGVGGPVGGGYPKPYQEPGPPQQFNGGELDPAIAPMQPEQKPMSLGGVGGPTDVNSASKVPGAALGDVSAALAEKAGKMDIINKAGGFAGPSGGIYANIDAGNLNADGITNFDPNTKVPSLDPTMSPPQLAPSEGVQSIYGPPSAATFMGRAGNPQQIGGGRFGGNPPPGVLARRGGGIMDRRNALNNRMRARISPLMMGGNIGL